MICYELECGKCVPYSMLSKCRLKIVDMYICIQFNTFQTFLVKAPAQAVTIFGKCVTGGARLIPQTRLYIFNFAEFRIPLFSLPRAPFGSKYDVVNSIIVGSAITARSTGFPAHQVRNCCCSTGIFLSYIIKILLQLMWSLIWADYPILFAPRSTPHPQPLCLFRL